MNKVDKYLDFTQGKKPKVVEFKNEKKEKREREFPTKITERTINLDTEKPKEEKEMYQPVFKEQDNPKREPREPPYKGQKEASILKLVLLVILTCAFLFIALYSAITFANKDFSTQVTNNVDTPDVPVNVSVNTITNNDYHNNFTLNLDQYIIDSIANQVANKLNISNNTNSS